MRPRREIRDGRTWCNYHGAWEPIEDFDWVTKQGNFNGSVETKRIPRPNCRLAEQTIRDHGRDADPARYAIEGRAKELAGDMGKAIGSTISFHFVLIELNHRALVPIMRALLSPDGRCLNCGRHRHETRQLHIEHRIPPLHTCDWPAQHARNLWIACAGCNLAKGRRDNDRDWLEREHRKWMIDREWADHAGEKGWPPYDPAFGQISLASEAKLVPQQMTIDDMLALGALA